MSPTPQNEQPTVGAVRRPNPATRPTGSQAEGSPYCDPHNPRRAQALEGGRARPRGSSLAGTWVHRKTRGASARPRSFVAKRFPGRSRPSPRMDWCGGAIICFWVGGGCSRRLDGAGAGQGAGHVTLSSAGPLCIPAPPGSPSPETFQDSFCSRARAALHPSQGRNLPVPAAYLDYCGIGKAWRGCGSALGFIGP